MKTLEEFIDITTDIHDGLGESVLTCDRDGVVRYINGAALALLGLSKRQALHKPLDEIIGTATTSRLKAAGFQALSGPALRFKASTNGVKGRLFASPVMLGRNYAECVGAVLVLREKTLDYRIAVRDFKRRNNMIRAIDKLKDRICLVNDIKIGRQVFVSEGFKTILGWSANTILNGNWAFVSTLMHPQDFPRVKKELQTTIGKYLDPQRRFDNEPFNTRYRTRHKNGQWCRSRKTAVCYNGIPTARHCTCLALWKR